MTTASSFSRNLGLAGGSLWLIAAGTGFVIWASATVHSGIATALLAIVSASAITLILFGIALIVGVSRLPHGPVDDPSRRSRLLRGFGITFAAEAAGCALVATICSSTHHWKLIVPLILVVVGLHFLPLARLFEVPRYYLLGALFCAVPIVTIFSTAPSAHIGDALSWIALPSIGCGLAALATGWAGLMEVHQFLNHSRTPSQACA
jgi:hypothetical protein